MTETDYTARDITVLEGLEPVRLRPGMYIGSTGLRGPPSPHLRGRRQLGRRGAPGTQRPDRGHPPSGQLGHGPGLGLGHPRRRDAGPGTAGADGRPHEAPRRREVRRRRLQGLGRPARRRRLGRQRALRAARRRGAPRRQDLPAGVRARRADRRHGGRREDGQGRRGRDDDHLPARLRDLRGARRRRGDDHAAPARDRVPHQGPPHQARRRARGRQDRRVPLRGRHPRLRLVHQRGEGRDPQAHRLFRGRDRPGRRRGGDAVELLLPGVGLHLRQQHQHGRGRHAPLRLPQRADPHAEREGQRAQAPEGEGEPRRRGRPRRARRRRLGQAAEPAVRGADEDEARQSGHRGSRPDDRQLVPVAVPRGEPAGRARDLQQGDRGDARAARGAAGARADAAQVGARRLLAAGQARRLLDPRPVARGAATSSRATRPAARRRPAATAPTRRSCRCAGRSSTARRTGSTRCSRTTRSRR